MLNQVEAKGDGVMNPHLKTTHPYSISAVVVSDF